MLKINRREFLTLSAKIAALMGISTSGIPSIADALEQLSTGNAPVLWLQGQSCSGCSVSLMNSENPGPAQILTRYISLLFHSTLSTATGDKGMDIVHRCMEMGDFFLVGEGSIPVKMPEACVMGHEKIGTLVLRAAQRAKAVIAVGTCASFGGIPAAENNMTGAVGVPEYLETEGVKKPIIRIPGCPAHPDWIMGTLAHVLRFGLPKLDAMGRPVAFYSKLLHDQCPRFADYERENFAKTFSDSGCLFKLGCLGTNTYADCTTRYWNSGTNSCIPAGAPCIGCASENFAKKASFPFYRKGEHGLEKEEKKA
jgi:hydrogenase small subunit